MNAGMSESTNATTYLKSMSKHRSIWNYSLGGYQVPISGPATARAPSSDVPSPATKPQSFNHVCRIASILALHENLDGHYGASV
jgi:hypothetical protein